jgi:List-Bact-rpt repeat protein
MSSPGGGHGIRWDRTKWATLAAILLVAVLLPTPGLLSHRTAAAPPVAPGRVTPAAYVAAPTHPDVRPASSPNVTGTFYQNTSSFSLPSSTNELCTPYYTENYCDDQSQSPSLLNLSSGNLGVTYSQVTSYNTTTCLYPSQNATGGSINVSVYTYIRVLFSASSNGGGSFGSPTYINESCPYAQQFEPSFAVAPSGTIDGAFVEANATAKQMNLYAFETPLGYYYPRYQDALAFVNSTNNGASFSNATLVVASNISRPAIATFGDTIYIVYENVSAGNTTIASGYPSGQYPTSINLVYSTDQGATWHGPYTLPGENATLYNTSYSPSITVTPTGLVAVAYDTNRTCLFMCGTAYAAYGEDIVVATSSSNGTSWNGPYTVRSAVNEPSYFGSSYTTGTYQPFIFQFAPATSIAYDPLSGNLYVAFSGAYNTNATYFYYDFTQSVVWGAVSTNLGINWASKLVSPPAQTHAEDFEGGAFLPAVAVHNGEVFLTFTFYNYSNGGACGSSTYLSYSYGQYLVTSSDGVSWTAPGLVTLQPQTFGGENYLGYTASIAFSATGSPILAYAQMMPYTFSYNYPYYSFTYNNAVEVASVWTGATVSLTVFEHGLAPGASWSFIAGANQYTLTTNNTTITNVPNGVPVFLDWPGPAVWTGFEEFFAVTDPTQMVNLASSTTYTFDFSGFVGFNGAVQPPNIPEFELELFNSSGHSFDFYGFWDTYFNGVSETTIYNGCPFPWYLPVGLHFVFSLTPTPPIESYYYTTTPITYWNGTGNGNFTGLGADANITMNGAINETAWALPTGIYNETFYASGLPGSSVYSLSVDGANYASPAPQSLVVHGLVTGAHWLSDITANSSSSGWQYFGRSGAGNPIIVPDRPTDNLTFAYVDVGAPAGVVSFRASNLTAGTVWQLEFNGTIYSSSTPWINLTTHPGNYTETAFPVTSENASVGYTPVVGSSTVSVTPGSTYLVNYTSTYQLQVIAGVGGRVTPANASFWVVPGTVKTFTATASVGYTFDGWTGRGPGAYTGPNATATVTVNGPVVETAAFVPLPGARFNLTVQEVGIPNGTSWSAYVGGVGYSSTTWQINVSQVYSCAVSGARGVYPLALPYDYANGTPAQTRYLPVTPPPTACGGQVTTLHFAPQYFFTLQTTGGGSVSAVVGSSVLTNGSWVASGALVSLAATANPGYVFLGWNGTGVGNYTGAQSQPQVQLFGPVSELAVFAPIILPPPPRYTWSFQAIPGFPVGTSWGLTLNGVNFSSDTSFLNVSGLLAGSYTATVGVVSSSDGLTEWRAVTPAPFHVSGNGSTQIAFNPYYWFDIRASGPGTVSPTSGAWYALGSSITLVATPTLPALFVGWQGTGTGAYSGPLATTQVRVNGPMTEVATFVPPAPAVKTLTSAYTSTGLIVGLAIVGLVVGLIVGLLAARMRGGRGDEPPGTMNPPSRPEAAGAATSGATPGGPEYLEDESPPESPAMADDGTGGGNP